MRNAYLLALACILAALAFAAPRAAAEPADAGRPAMVYVVPVKGMIESALLYVIRRGVAEAEQSGAQAIVLVMDTPGGTLKAAGDIVHLLQRSSIPTYTFVEKDAFSAGAIIALSTDHIYMAPGSVIGDAMPIMMSPMGGAQEMPAAIEEKTVSAVSAMIRAAAQENGHDPQLAEAMVRREVEYKIGDDVISPAGQLLTLTNVEAEREVGPPEARRRLLSTGTVADVPALLKAIGLEGATVRELEVTSAERIARFIAALAPLLLMAGLLGLYIEFKTPGFGLPGVLGLLALALFFWGHHIAGLAGMEEMVIFLVGVVLVAVEVFVLPGFGLPGVIGICLIIWSLLGAMTQRLPSGSWVPDLQDLRVPTFNLSLGIIMAAGAAAMLARFLPRSPAFRWLVLTQATRSAAGYTAAASTADLLGRQGTALTALRPAGTALFGEQRLDVVTRGAFIEQGRVVKVVEAHGSRVVVEAIENGGG